MVTIRLTPAEAGLVMRQIDGWMDAGACPDGLEADENAALGKAHDQILKQLQKLKGKP